MKAATFLFVGSLMVAGAALAQAPPPSDLELLQTRAQAAESRADYLSMLLRRMQAEEIKTAQWWADYIGLKPEPAQPPK